MSDHGFNEYQLPAKTWGPLVFETRTDEGPDRGSDLSGSTQQAHEQAETLASFTLLPLEPLPQNSLEQTVCGVGLSSVAANHVGVTE